ncbi:MAG: hypothetical protein S4CHLAM2_06450 [Chlamydiales bacterium]|nr:hypothetical protein [Chlamydiales bacterium]
MSKLKGRRWATDPNVELIQADVLDYPSLEKALQGCTVAYYLIHSMIREQKDFTKADREAALNFVAAAEKTDLERIIYLGGLGSEKGYMSKHLQSRREVGEILRQSSIPVTIFQAAMIIGSGSASFEILRYLTDRLPIMVTPTWVRTPCQPIAVKNVLEYLIGTLDAPETVGQTFDIGGPRVTTYHELMMLYAKVAKLPLRKVIPVSILSPKLSSYWIGLVTPLPPKLGRPLVEGLSSKVICEDARIQKLIPQTLMDYEEAISRAMDKINPETSWADAGIMPPAEWADRHDPKWAGGTIFKARRERMIEASQQSVWKVVTGIGGKKGWYSTSWLWKIRGTFDKLIGGVGLRRGRRDTTHLQVGDAVDFWRVKQIVYPERLLLVAEMRLPGEAILDFRLTRIDENLTKLEQTARFFPSGLWGMLYWWILTPFHLWIFTQMIRTIKKLSQQEDVIV